MFDMARLTPLLIVGTPFIIGAIDIFLYYRGGNEATISKVMLNHAGNRPFVGAAVVYSFGVLIGHFYFPTFVEQTAPMYELIGRMMLVLAPTFYAMIIIAAGNGTMSAHNHALIVNGQLSYAGILILAGIAGGVAGKYALPQHLAP